MSKKSKARKAAKTFAKKPPMIPGTNIPSANSLSNEELDDLLKRIPPERLLTMACKVFRERAPHHEAGILRLFALRDDRAVLARTVVPAEMLGFDAIPMSLAPPVVINEMDFLTAVLVSRKLDLFSDLVGMCGLDLTESVLIAGRAMTRIEHLVWFYGHLEYECRQALGDPRVGDFFERMPVFYERLFSKTPAYAFPVALEDPFYDSGGAPLRIAVGSGNTLAEKVIRRIRAEAERDDLGAVVRRPEPVDGGGAGTGWRRGP